MARSYDAAVTALTIGAPFKWVDNLLSRYRIAGVQQDSQGTTRRLSPEAILRVHVVRILTEDLGLAVGRAVALAEELCVAQGGRVELAEGVATITLNLEALERRISDRLRDAVESVPMRTRGRPPSRRVLPED